MPTPQHDTTDQLFFTSPESGVLIERDFDATQNGAVSLKEHYAGLIELLNMRDRLVDLERISNSAPLPKVIDETTRLTKQQATARNAKFAISKVQEQSRKLFDHVTGVDALEAAADNETLPVQREYLSKVADRHYNYFTRRFSGSQTTKERFNARQKWSKILDVLLTEQTPQATTQEVVTEEPGLSTHEKLIILAEAEDAGFLPTTNEEKNMVLTYLDYVRSDEFELGAQSQLLEVGNFHGKHQSFEAAKEYAEKAGRSIAFEFADWYLQASQQLTDLQEVKQLLQDTDNPNLSLAIALNADMLKAIPLIRFMDLAELRAKEKIAYKVGGEVVTPKFAVLRTKRNEAASNVSIGKNKTLEDPYTAEERPEEATKWLKKRMMQLKVGDVRGVIQEAIQDQANRVAFHRLVLEDLAIEKTDSKMLGEASKIAQGVLQGQQV